jgi:hypothetical protein
MDKTKPIIVLAGNYQQFREYAHDDKRFVFGDSVDKMRGLNVSGVVEVGTFWKRKDAGELYREAKQRVR